ncbi:hypothetical protein L6270_03465 [Candidatus Parcubacteria bacterium]|nr:hypothetical protein [Patescibacteria group bacterium]MBU4309022.1 hypothetical protein [Patescibacteria group bacterium]MBU4432383.1 hypothetical protein [Patescibacteria group bacterium]MBU4577383.1 hypothetical protein [Patescibacteria group bacterium]MCG2697071.1 hypothetical protein [Candidatus Parcubacteria bacterium]
MPIFRQENITPEMFNNAVDNMSEDEKIVPVNDGASNLVEDDDNSEKQLREKMITDARELERENLIMSGEIAPDYHPNSKDNCSHRYGCGEQYKPKNR